MSKHDFAFNPDNGPARLFRYVEPGVLPSNVVSIFHEKDNLLIINKGLFDLLSDFDKKQVLRTREPSLVALMDTTVVASRTHDEALRVDGWQDFPPSEEQDDAA